MNPEQWEWLCAILMRIEALLVKRPSGDGAWGEDDGTPHLKEDKDRGKGYWIVSQDEPGACRDCEERIYWHRTYKGKNMPLDANGRSHFDTCRIRNPQGPKPLGSHPAPPSESFPQAAPPQAAPPQQASTDTYGPNDVPF